MYKKEKEELYKEFCETVTKKHFLKTIGVRKKDITVAHREPLDFQGFWRHHLEHGFVRAFDHQGEDVAAALGDTELAIS